MNLKDRIVIWILTAWGYIVVGAIFILIMLFVALMKIVDWSLSIHPKRTLKEILTELRRSRGGRGQGK